MSVDTSAIDELLTTGFAGLTLGVILQALLAAVVCLVVIKILLKITDRALRRLPMDAMLKKLLRGALKALLVFIAVIVVLEYLNIQSTSLVALLSVVGLAVSLAVQNFLSNVAGGLQLIASKPFRIGDFVEIAGCSGTVTEIGLFYTKLNSADNKLLQLPNSAIVSANIINHYGEEFRRVEITVSAAYESDTELVRSVLLTLAGEHPLTVATPAPEAHVTAYQDSTIAYILRCWCAAGDYWKVYFDLMDALKPAFDRAGIEMSYPHVNVHMVEGKGG